MLISEYNPDCKATCPKCGYVNCKLEAGLLAFGKRYIDLYHEKCGTRWRYYIDSQEEKLVKGI